MGSFSSTPLTCVYTKQDFNNKLNVLRDAHSVTQFYAKLLLNPTVQSTLKFKMYSENSISYFLRNVNDKKSDLNNQSYFDFNNSIVISENNYNRTDYNESAKRNLLTDTFNKCITVQKLLIEELYDSCQYQGDPSQPDNFNVDDNYSDNYSDDSSSN